MSETNWSYLLLLCPLTTKQYKATYSRPPHLPKSRRSVATAEPRISSSIIVGVSHSPIVIGALRSSSVSPPSSATPSPARFRRPAGDFEPPPPPPWPPSALAATAALCSASTDKLDFFRGATPPPEGRLIGASPDAFLLPAAVAAAATSASAFPPAADREDEVSRLCGVTLTPFKKTRTPPTPPP